MGRVQNTVQNSTSLSISVRPSEPHLYALHVVGVSVVVHGVGAALAAYELEALWRSRSANDAQTDRLPDLARGQSGLHKK